MRRTYRGTVLLELLLLIPIMVIVAVCGVEFTRCMRYLKIAQALSKEAANTAFRECGSLRSLQMSNCLEMVESQMTPIAKLMSGGPASVATNVSHVNLTVFVAPQHASIATVPAEGGGTDTFYSARFPDDRGPVRLPNRHHEERTARSRAQRYYQLCNG